MHINFLVLLLRIADEIIAFHYSLERHAPQLRNEHFAFRRVHLVGKFYALFCRLQVSMVSLQAGLDALLGANGATLKAAQIAEGSRVSVVWSDGSKSLYPMLMLRDCCPCEKCFSPTVNSRIILFEHIIGSSCSVNTLNVQVTVMCTLILSLSCAYACYIY